MGPILSSPVGRLGDVPAQRRTGETGRAGNMVRNTRRQVLSGSVALALAAGLGFPGLARAARLSGKSQPFSREWLVQLAEAAAKKAVDTTQPKLPAFIDKLDYDAYRDVRFRADQALWREQNLPFTA